MRKMKKKGQRTFNNENMHRMKMLGLTLYPLYSPWLLDIFHQRGNVIDSLPASKNSAPCETKCLTSPSLSTPQKLSRTTLPETHRSRIIREKRLRMRQVEHFRSLFRSQQSLPRALGFILCAACGSVVLLHAARHRSLKQLVD